MYDTFMDLMTRGGPVMWVIFFTAWLALILLAERGLRIQLWLAAARRDHQRLAEAVECPSGESAQGLRSPIAYICRNIDWREADDEEGLSKQINARLAEVMPLVEGRLSTIAVIGSLLPMLGLLGTVVGMIEVFEVIALRGTGDPQQMANGISQALLTTASGLIIAIPVIFAHHLLVRRLRRLMALTEQSIYLLLKRRGDYAVSGGVS